MNHIRLAILEDGTFEVWNKDKGVTITLLDYRGDLYKPEIIEYGEDQIGPNGDY